VGGDPYLGVARLIAGLVRSGFAYAEVIEMTWSQWEYFSRAIRLAEIEHLEMLILVQHNPYAKEPQKLSLRLHAEAAALKRLPRQGGRGSRRSPGVRLQDFERALGPIKTIVLTPEEMEKRLGPRQHPKG